MARKILCLIAGFLIVMLMAGITGSFSFHGITPAADQDTLIFNKTQLSHLPDTIHHQFIKETLTERKTDSRFTYASYVDFLLETSDTSRYIVVPLNEFTDTINPGKIVIGLRHDVDVDLNKAHNLSIVENNVGARLTYFILHTAGYYLADPKKINVHAGSIIPVLQAMQNYYHHEIGWHNDLVTLQLVYEIDPARFLEQELEWLRTNGLDIVGTASHGSAWCYTYKYLNFYFFEECKNSVIGQFVNNDSAFVKDRWIRIRHGRLSDYGLNYEAYFLDNNKYYSDAQFVNGKRWSIDMLDLNSLRPGDRVILLLHPVYYSQTGSSAAEITSFSLNGQVRSQIDKTRRVIRVVLPAGSAKDSLRAVFSLSSNARALHGSGELHSGKGWLDFTCPVTIKVIAEDGLSSANWEVRVVDAENSLMLSASELTIGSETNSTATFEIVSNTSWQIESTENWLVPDMHEGAGNADVNLSAGANPGLFPRSALVRISGYNVEDQYIIVTQHGGTTGIDEEKAETDDIILYPNPAQTYLFVNGAGPDPLISIIDISGRTLLEEKLHDGKIDISSLSRGVYTLIIEAGDKTAARKFIKR